LTIDVHLYLQEYSEGPSDNLLWCIVERTIELGIRST
jgi:hypothetical protein